MPQYVLVGLTATRVYKCTCPQVAAGVGQGGYRTTLRYLRRLHWTTTLNGTRVRFSTGTGSYSDRKSSLSNAAATLPKYGSNVAVRELTRIMQDLLGIPYSHSGVLSRLRLLPCRGGHRSQRALPPLFELSIARAVSNLRTCSEACSAKNANACTRSKSESPNSGGCSLEVKGVPQPLQISEACARYRSISAAHSSSVVRRPVV